MKIYVNDIIIQKNIEYDITEKKSYIYTSDGIYRYKKELQKIEITENIREKDYKNYHFFIDDSIIQYTEVLYHIPYINLFCEETISKKAIGEGIYFVKESYFDQISYYFETEINSDTNETFDVLISFLSSN